MYEIKLKGDGVRPIIATTNATCFAGAHWDEGGGKITGIYQVTAQIVGADVVVVEELMVSSHGKRSESVATTNIPIRSLPHTLALSQTLPVSGCPAEHARVTILKVKPRVRDRRLPETSIKVGDDSAAAREKLLAAGGTPFYLPEAPVTTSPMPVVDRNGHTNWVSRTTPVPLHFTMKDGRRIAMYLADDGKTVAGITVEPPLETND